MAPSTGTPLITRTYQRIPTKAAFLYPIRGIVYFSRHRFLWPLLRSRILPATLLSFFVLFTLFFWTYIPQVLFLAIFHGRAGAFINGAFLVLGEGAAITALLFEAWFADTVMLDAFDSVLVAEGEASLLADAGDGGREVLGQDGGNEQHLDPRTRLGRPRGNQVYSPFNVRQIVEFILLLPLNLIPWIGIPLFLWLTGYRAGPLQHYRYFELKGLKRKEKAEHVKRKRVQYTAAGCMALVLQLVPVLSMVFLLTTAVGSALWAVELERQERRLKGSTTTTGRSGTDESPPPEYTEYIDDPV